MAAAGQKKSNGKQTSQARDVSLSYNKFKKFEGEQYTGMKVGRSHSGTMIKASGKRKRSHLICGKYLTQLPSEEQEKRQRVPECR